MVHASSNDVDCISPAATFVIISMKFSLPVCYHFHLTPSNSSDPLEASLGTLDY